MVCRPLHQSPKLLTKMQTPRPALTLQLSLWDLRPENLHQVHFTSDFFTQWCSTFADLKCPQIYKEHLCMCMIEALQGVDSQEATQREHRPTSYCPPGTHSA